METLWKLLKDRSLFQTSHTAQKTIKSMLSVAFFLLRNENNIFTFGHY